MIKGESGHVPVRTLLPAPPDPPPPVGSPKEPNSPGYAILVSPPPPQATIIKADKNNVVFLIDLKNIICPSKEYMYVLENISVTWY